VVDPRAAQVDGCAREIDGVEPTANAIAGFQHDTLDAGATQSRSRGQSRDTGTDDDDPTDRSLDFAHRAILSSFG